METTEFLSQYRHEYICQVLCRQDECEELKVVDETSSNKPLRKIESYLTHWTNVLESNILDYPGIYSGISIKQFEKLLNTFVSLQRYQYEFRDNKSIDSTIRIKFKISIQRSLTGLTDWLIELKDAEKDKYNSFLKHLGRFFERKIDAGRSITKEIITDLQLSIELLGKPGGPQDYLNPNVWIPDSSSPVIIGDLGGIEKRIHKVTLKENNTFSQAFYTLKANSRGLNTTEELDHLIRFQNLKVLSVNSILKKTQSETVFCTEFLMGNLDFENKKDFPEQLEMLENLSVHDFINGLMEGLFISLTELHRNGYAHDDMAPRNILFNKTPHKNEYTFKICDFGSTRVIRKDENEDKIYLEELKKLEDILNQVKRHIVNHQKMSLSSMITDFYNEFDELFKRPLGDTLEDYKNTFFSNIKKLKQYLPENCMSEYTAEELFKFDKTLAGKVKVIFPTVQELQYLFSDWNSYMHVGNFCNETMNGDTEREVTLADVIEKAGIAEFSKQKYFFGIRNIANGMG